jgi:hypothetical protein
MLTPDVMREYLRSSLHFLVAEADHGLRADRARVCEAASGVMVYVGGRITTVREICEAINDEILARSSRGEFSCIAELAEAAHAYRCHEAAGLVDPVAGRAILTFSGWLDISLHEINTSAADARDEAIAAMYGSDAVSAWGEWECQP